jgi:hypothetical protein
MLAANLTAEDPMANTHSSAILPQLWTVHPAKSTRIMCVDDKIYIRPPGWFVVCLEVEHSCVVDVRHYNHGKRLMFKLHPSSMVLEIDLLIELTA